MASIHMQGLSSPNSIMVNVWCRSRHLSYQLHRRSTVGELRQQVATDLGVAPEEIKMLLGGGLLDDGLTIEDSGVGMESTLFAIHHRPSATDTASAAAPSPQPASQLSPPTSAATATTVTTTVTTGGGAVAAMSEVARSRDEHVRQLTDQYYVYCKVCRHIRAGRLRVKCSVCEGGAVLLDRGPGGWEDVLTPGRLTATCLGLHCQESQPVFYFKCAEPHGGSGEGGPVVVLRHIRPNRHCVPCITCEDVMSPVVVFPCEWNHVMCLGCFEEYCSVRLKERGFRHTEQYGYTLSCPAGCPESFIQEQHHFCVLGGELYERYKDFAAEECLMAEGGVFCPRQHCASGFLLDTTDTWLTCPHCRHVFCRHCRQDRHDGTCPPVSTPGPQDFSDAERAQRAQWEQQTADQIEKTTKACPGCHTRTERDGGCMHMKCARCGEEWCWMCVKTWDRDCQGTVEELRSAHT